MIQVQWTCANIEEAKKIAQALIEQRLAACVNILPAVESIYLWKDKIETSCEVKVFIKTLRERFPEVRDYISGHCSYETPEIVFFEIGGTAHSYGAWMKNVCGPPSR